MARPLRIHVPGAFHHVTLRGNHQQPLFRAATDRGLLNTIVRNAIDKHGARVHAYCWMTNHLHFFVQVGNEPLSGLMRDIAAGYAREFQKNLKTTGHLFERRYHSVIVDTDRYLFAVLRYIHLNPVAAGIVASPFDYRWSSHLAYLGFKFDPWVTVDFALRMFADTEERARLRYVEFIAEQLARPEIPLDEPRGEGKQFLGDDDFIARMTNTPARTSGRRDLESIIEDVCREFSIDRAALATRSRHQSVAKIRALIVERAITRGSATLAEIARKLECDRKTLREALKRNGISMPR